MILWLGVRCPLIDSLRYLYLTLYSIPSSQCRRNLIDSMRTKVYLHALPRAPLHSTTLHCTALQPPPFHAPALYRVFFHAFPLVSSLDLLSFPLALGRGLQSRSSHANPATCLALALAPGRLPGPIYPRCSGLLTAIRSISLSVDLALPLSILTTIGRLGSAPAGRVQERVHASPSPFVQSFPGTSLQTFRLSNPTPPRLYSSNTDGRRSLVVTPPLPHTSTTTSTPGRQVARSPVSSQASHPFIRGARFKQHTQ